MPEDIRGGTVSPGHVDRSPLDGGSSFRSKDPRTCQLTEVNVQDVPEGRFSLLSAMVLIAATAPGLALMRRLPEFIAIHDEVTIYKILGVNSGSGWMFGRDRPKLKNV